MELSNLKELNSIFRSLHNKEINYADFFCDRRLLIFSSPAPVSVFSWYCINQYTAHYTELTNLSIDAIYCTSCDPFVVPFVPAHSKLIQPLLDKDKIFTNYLRDYSDLSVDLIELSKFWQYVVIVNNGQVEKLFSNDIHTNMSLKEFTNSEYQYKNLEVDIIKKYLLSV
jgi:peroxiredoxin